MIALVFDQVAACASTAPTAATDHNNSDTRRPRLRPPQHRAGGSRDRPGNKYCLSQDIGR